MTEHLSTEIVERFHQQALAAKDRVVIYNHLLKCEACRKQVVDPDIEAFAFDALSEHLVSESEHHPDYETLELYVDRRLVHIDRDRLDAHLKTCRECFSEVTDLSDSLAAMGTASIRDHEQQIPILDRNRSFSGLLVFLRPLRFSAIVALVILAVIAAVVVWRLKSGGSVKVPGGQDLTAGSSPTPSPSNIQFGGSEPNPGPSPRNLVEPNPVRRPSERAPEMVALNDGPNRIVLDRSGRLIGLESLPSESQLAVKEILTAESFKKPAILDQLDVPEVSVRAPSENDEKVRLVYPANRVIEEDRPRFEWVPSTRATAYRVEIGDANFHQVAKSEDLPPTTSAWTPPTSLKRGVVYTWVIRAIDVEGKSSTSQAKFKLLSDEKIAELTRLRTSPSRLALAIFYAREGMNAEAEREFDLLALDNPRSKLIPKLLRQIRSWQRR
jgi:predicted anti-sigma-YlaC factor YlaD